MAGLVSAAPNNAGYVSHRLGMGYTLPPEIGMQRTQLRRPRLVGGAIITENGVLESQDFVDTAGARWRIAGDGTFVFAGGTFEGDIFADSFSTGETGEEHIEIQSSDKSTIYFYTGSVDEDLPGFIEANDGVLAGGTSGTLFLQAPVLHDDGSQDAGAIILHGRNTSGSVPPAAYITPAGVTGGGAITEYIGIIKSGGSNTNEGVSIATQGKMQLAADGQITLVTVSGEGGDIVLQADGQVTWLGSNSSLDASGNAQFDGAISAGGTVTGGGLATAGTLDVDGTCFLGDSTHDSSTGRDHYVDRDLIAQHDVVSNGAGQGVIVRSIDGNYWRLGVTNSGAISIVDI